MYTLFGRRKEEKGFAIQITDYEITDDTHLIAHRYFHPNIDWLLEEFQMVAIVAYPMAGTDDMVFLWADGEVKRDAQNLHAS